ncbi:MAG: hypothetical protein P4L83_13045 [Nevskia sp.]|nr:hypothetical protein [Nevskia sp.]
MSPFHLQFQTRVAVPAEEAWRWMTSVKGVAAEVWPVLRLTTPTGLQNLTDLKVAPGRRLFRSWILLGGILPIDCSDLILLEVDPGKGFVEESPMASMRLWRHERRISQADGLGCVITDTLMFQPRFAPRLVAWFIRRLFTHRHAVLRQRLNGTTVPV